MSPKSQQTSGYTTTASKRATKRALRRDNDAAISSMWQDLMRYTTKPPAKEYLEAVPIRDDVSPLGKRLLKCQFKTFVLTCIFSLLMALLLFSVAFDHSQNLLTLQLSPDGRLEARALYAQANGLDPNDPILLAQESPRPRLPTRMEMVANLHHPDAESNMSLEEIMLAAAREKQEKRLLEMQQAGATADAVAAAATVPWS